MKQGATALNQALVSCCGENNLSLNVNKTKEFISGLVKKGCFPTLHISNTLVEKFCSTFLEGQHQAKSLLDSKHPIPAKKKKKKAEGAFGHSMSSFQAAAHLGMAAAV